MEVNVQSIADKILHTSTLSPIPANNKTPKKQVNQMKNNMKSIVENVLLALASLNIAAGLGPLIT